MAVLKYTKNSHRLSIDEITRLKELFTKPVHISEEGKEKVCKAIIDTTEKMLKSSPLLIRKTPNNC